VCWHGHQDSRRDGSSPTILTGQAAGARSAETRYATFGFSDKATLDDGTVWPVTFALMRLTAADEARIGALVKKAVA
jgi:hypothetical protein